MKLRAVALSGVAGLLLCVGVGVPASAAQDGVAKAPPSFLFVFEGRNAELTPVKGKAGRFELKVPIRNSEQWVTWFTDRPIRDAGHLSMGDFVRLWQVDGGDGFKADPPNVAIAFGGKTLIATMTGPRVVRGGGGSGSGGSGSGGSGSAGSDGSGEGKALVSTMTLVKGQDLADATKGSRGLAAHAKRAGANTHSGSSRIGNVSVFVDMAGCFGLKPGGVSLDNPFFECTADVFGVA